MPPIQLLLILTTSVSVGTAILGKVGEADLDAVRIRLEEEKAKRLLLQNDVEVLMLQVEELKRGFSNISKDRMALSENVTFVTPSIAFTAKRSKETTIGPGQTVIFENVNVNEGNCYDSSTGKFRAPFRGLYSFSVTIMKGPATEVHLLIIKDNAEIGRVYSGYALYDSGSATVVTVMDKDQVVYCKAWNALTAETMYGDNWDIFTGLLHARYN